MAEVTILERNEGTQESGVEQALEDVMTVSEQIGAARETLLLFQPENLADPADVFGVNLTLADTLGRLEKRIWSLAYSALCKE